MKAIRTITRYIPRFGFFDDAPRSEEVRITLVADDFGGYYISTPFAALPARADATDAQLAAGVRPSFATSEEAENFAKREYPHWNNTDCKHIRAHIIFRYQFDNMGNIIFNTAEKLGGYMLPIREWALGKRIVPKEYRAAVRELSC